MKYNLSEVHELIADRRTVYPKDYSNRKVHKEIVMKLLDNARWAPSHGMTQPWRFAVFMEEGLNKLADFQSNLYKKKKIGDAFRQTKYDKLRENPLKTSVVIAIGMERQESGRIPEIEEVEAVACAVQNMQLTATAYGLGTYWSSGGVTYEPEVLDFLGLKEGDKCLGFLYLGYPNIEWPKSQRKPIEYFTNWITE